MKRKKQRVLSGVYFERNDCNSNSNNTMTIIRLCIDLRGIPYRTHEGCQVDHFVKLHFDQVVIVISRL